MILRRLDDDLTDFARRQTALARHPIGDADTRLMSGTADPDPAEPELARLG